MENITYTKVGDYNLPDLILPSEEENKEIGIFGERHLQYIKQHRRVLYTNLLTSCKLNNYLANINTQAEELFFRLVKELEVKDGVTENLKAENQMEWVQRINNIRHRAMEVVNNELIFK